MGLTTFLKIIKPVSEYDAQKIATLNVESDEFDAVVAGYLLLSVAGSSNVTLTRAQALNRRLKFTGVLTGNITIYLPVITNLAITPPTTTIGAARDYLVWNATTGAFTLTIKTSAVGSSGVAITQTKEVYISHDNTDVKKVTTEV
jgi:hypothetical protein